MLGWLVACRTLVSDTVLAMMFRQIRSTLLNFRPSTGICFMMSSLLKMGSRYSQDSWHLSHASRMSWERQKGDIVAEKNDRVPPAWRSICLPTPSSPPQRAWYKPSCASSGLSRCGRPASPVVDTRLGDALIDLKLNLTSNSCNWLNFDTLHLF